MGFQRWQKDRTPITASRMNALQNQVAFLQRELERVRRGNSAEGLQRQLRIPFQNMSGEEIPGYAVMEITGQSEGGALEVGKPSADGLDPSVLLINSGGVVPDGNIANGWNPECGKVPALYDSTDEAAGDMEGGSDLGTAEDSWKLSPSQTGLKCCGAIDESNEICRVSAASGGGGALELYVAVGNAVDDQVDCQRINADGYGTGDVIEGIII